MGRAGNSISSILASAMLNHYAKRANNGDKMKQDLLAIPKTRERPLNRKEVLIV
jgi:hypothetical protein